MVLVVLDVALRMLLGMEGIYRYIRATSVRIVVSTSTIERVLSSRIPNYPSEYGSSQPFSCSTRYPSRRWLRRLKSATNRLQHCKDIEERPLSQPAPGEVEGLSGVGRGLCDGWVEGEAYSLYLYCAQYNFLRNTREEDRARRAAAIAISPLSFI